MLRIRRPQRDTPAFTRSVPPRTFYRLARTAGVFRIRVGDRQRRIMLSRSRATTLTWQQPPTSRIGSHRGHRGELPERRPSPDLSQNLYRCYSNPNYQISELLGVAVLPATSRTPALCLGVLPRRLLIKPLRLLRFGLPALRTRDRPALTKTDALQTALSADAPSRPRRGDVRRCESTPRRSPLP